MMDQCTRFNSMGMQAEFVGEAQTNKEAIQRVISGKVSLVFITPESIVENPRYRKMLLSPVYKSNTVALVVDEAHCVKNWGDQFRQTFAKIGDLRSLLPLEVKILALTATATMETYGVAKTRLEMVEPVLISMSPERTNIYYCVCPPIEIEHFVDSLVGEFAIDFPKTIVFVRTYKDCSNLYLMLLHQLGGMFTFPNGYPNLAEFRRVEMYSRVLTADKRAQVLSSFSDSKSPLQLIISTSAFGMGVDILNIRRIIHWGLPTTIEEYVQEAGRAGRDGEKSMAILYGKGGRHATKCMKRYAENTSLCRRRLLFEGFLNFYESEIKASGCSCCDICKIKCTCEYCEVSN